MHFHTSSTFQTEELHPSYTFYSPSHSAAVGALDKKDLTTAVGDSLFNHTYDNTSAQCTLNMVVPRNMCYIPKLVLTQATTWFAFNGNYSDVGDK